MVNERKKQELKKLQDTVSGYAAVGVVDMHKLPGRQLHAIREKMRGSAVILVAKKALISRALADRPSLAALLRNEPGLLLTNENPFRLARLLAGAKTQARAKPGDIAPTDIVIKAGPTPLPPGPAIGDLQKMKIPAGVEGPTISIKKDTVVAKAGEKISKELAELMGKLNMEPMEIGVTLLAVQEGDIVYGREVLFVPQETYLSHLSAAHRNALSLAVTLGYPAAEAMPLLLAKAHRQATSLADTAAYPTKEGIGTLLAKGQAQAEALKHAQKP